MKEEVIEKQEYPSWFALSLCYILLSYRSKLQVREVMQRSDGAYYLCPRWINMVRVKEEVSCTSLTQVFLLKK